MKYLGLDLGARRIGVAVGELIASELTTLRAPRSQSFYQQPAQQRAYEQIEAIANEQSAQAIVVGLPVDQSGHLTKEADLIRHFGAGLAVAIGKPVKYVNETLTSAIARDILESQGVSEREAQQRVDQLSAQLILQQYLEENALA